MKTLLATAVAAAMVLASGAAYAASAQIVSGGQGAEGAAWAPILFAIVVFGFVMRALSQLGNEGMEGGDEQGKLEQSQNRR